MKNILFDLAEMTKKHPNKTAFIFLSKDPKSTEVNQISFKELDEKSSRAATLLSREGFHDGIVTIVLAKPSIDFVILLYGMLKTGAVPLLLPSLNIRTKSGREELRKILKRANPRGIIGNKFSIFVSQFLFLKKKPEKKLIFSKLKQFYSDDSNPNSFNINSDMDWAESAAFVKYTTGTTGPAKGVIYTHRMLHSHLQALRSEGINDQDVFYGRGGTLIVHPLIGSSSVLNLSSPKQTTGLDIVSISKKWSVTTAILSPPTAINLADYISKQESRNADKMLPSIKRLYVGGESVSAQVAEIIEPHLSDDCPSEGGFHSVYGATEGFPLCYAPSSILSETQQQTASGRGVCLGNEAGEIDLRILSYSESDDFHDIPPVKNQGPISKLSIGEISVNGPVVYSSLIGQDEGLFGGANSWATRKKDGTRWHRTGDLGYRDQEGRIWIVGRKSHSVKLHNGLFLHTKPVEEFFNSRLGIRTAIVQGLDNQKPILIVEKSVINWPEMRTSLKNELSDFSESFGEKLNLEFIHYGKSFPVDSGHEAKIEREKLNHWAIKKLKNKRS
ncbi:MAG: hypothetical protein CL971_01845 [Euryarchaeota archaeon]|nr:hypothetical protein [Euryarchaeota archaeon]